MDYSQGDPEAGRTASIFSAKSVHAKEFNRSKPSNRRATFLEEIEKLTEPLNDTDFKPFMPNNKSKPYSNGCKSRAVPSIEDLRKESKTLLSHDRIKIGSPALHQTLLDKDSLSGDSTIFDLCTQDRQRVGHLIKELVESHDRIQELNENLDKAQKSEAKYRHKCSELMKKLDTLGENHQKVQDEKERLKQQHLKSLEVLRNQITAISDRFEASIAEQNKLK
jgi:uncharacterized coiled-coil protein SlyX